MAALLLRQIVGIWQAAQGNNLADIALWTDTDPAGAVEEQLLATHKAPMRDLLPPLENGEPAPSPT
eukprot:12703843-Prorocentrum_lima.AAC.1